MFMIRLSKCWRGTCSCVGMLKPHILSRDGFVAFDFWSLEK